MTRTAHLDLDWRAPDPQPDVELSDCTDLVHVDTASACEATGRTFRRCAACRWTSSTDEAAVNPRAIGAHR